MNSKEINQSVLNQYKENEGRNDHSKNYLLLANYMRDDEAITIARLNIEFSKQHGYVNMDMRNLAHKYCNPYHAILIANCKG